MNYQQQKAVELLVGQFKSQVLMMLNETADEFETMDLSPDQRDVYNQFTEKFGKKILSIQVQTQ